MSEMSSRSAKRDATQDLEAHVIDEVRGDDPRTLHSAEPAPVDAHLTTSLRKAFPVPEGSDPRFQRLLDALVARRGGSREIGDERPGF